MGFVKGRNITDNYLLTQELISTIGKKARGGNVALKLDMSKAYDQMSWRHIITMLRAFGFGERFIDLVLEAYQLSSGQLVNAQKSGFLVHPILPPARRRVIERITQFTRQELPIRYLGFPLYLGMSKSAYFGEVCQAVLARIMSWKSRLISLGGRIVLIKHMLASIPVHLLSAASSMFESYGEPDPLLQGFLTNGEWNGAMLRQYIPQELIPLILQHLVPNGDRRDEVVWSQTDSGKFTLASTFQEVCQARNYLVLHSQVWHSRIPLKVPFFMMRLLLEKLPLTDVLRRVGVQLASKCLCCQEGAIETLEHVFAEGQVAKGVWSYFGRICGVTQLGSSLWAWLTAWWPFSPRHAVRRFLFSVLPSFICWHIWKARNVAYYEGRQKPVARICHAIFLDVIGVVEIQFNQRLGVHTFL
ncbi:uncharacterized protein [Coffea arabica]|uniref:Reverse transcriptase zinc-binding domain-containing protein n=1 Tax=Coffea arabica TaxID=13443 RepID=A0ABM4VU57_COFAR